jgi:HSP20 family protein
MFQYRWNPMYEMTKAQRQLSAFLDEMLHQEPRAHNGHATWTPAVDVSETPEGYDFTVELPGVRPEAVEIEVKDNTLTIKGERSNVSLKEGARLHHQERPVGRFARVFRLSKPVDANSVAATYRDGLLSVSVPLQAEAKPRKIPVQG